MKKYICIRGWQRNSVGDIIEEWQYNKYPEEVKERNFKIYEPEPKQVKEIKSKTLTTKLETITIDSPKKEEIKHEVTPKFKSFNLEEDVKL